jgi:hypothetical protein
MSDSIDFSHFTAAKNNFEGNPGLCNLFKFLAIETWKRIEFTYIKPRIKAYETTLTQNIAFTINAYKYIYPGLSIEIWDADDESANGNDLELLVIFSRSRYDFYAPIQAKKIYRNSKYDAMDHGDQIEKLIKYAAKSKINGYPLYLLYNYIDPVIPELDPDNELYGCSIVDAYYLCDNYYNKRIKTRRDGSSMLTWKIPSFIDLHPDHAFPWHKLVCGIDGPGQLLQEILNIGDKERKRDIRIDLIEDTKNPEDYPGLINKQALTFNGWSKSMNKDLIKINDDRPQIAENVNSYDFNPQTRIVVTI